MRLREEYERIFIELNNREEARPAYTRGLQLYENGAVQILSQSKDYFELAVEADFDDFQLTFHLDDKLSGDCSCKAVDWCSHRVAAVQEILEAFESDWEVSENEGKEYTREGMIKRVLSERRDKARKAKYKILLADNIFGEHILVNEKAVSYKITIRDFEHEIAHCSCLDYSTNKLGTCKHLIYIFNYFATEKKIKKNKPIQEFPFVEIYLDPINEYRISCYAPRHYSPEIEKLLKKYFNKKDYISAGQEILLLPFLQEARAYKQILIRPEVEKKIESAFDTILLQDRAKNTQLDFSLINATLFPYQEEGIRFATFKKGAIIADEMGLGKTIQAIGTAIFKKQIFDFKKVLVICPASLKSQWKSEIDKFSNEKAIVVEGPPEERVEQYQSSEHYFFIINYETVLRDILELNKINFDFIILDEAQRIKNYETITANAIKSLHRNHSLVITGTPIENKLSDIYSIVGFAVPGMLSPLWEFSYRHCYFDRYNKNKITGYHNLQELKERLKTILIRREKKEVIQQLNNITSIDVFVELHPVQQDFHAGFAKAIATILRKKFKTPFDMQRLTMYLQSMRMVCDSSFLVDKETHHSPKMLELEEIVLQKLNLLNNERKIIIFSEWTTMNKIIGKMLAKNGIGYTELNGSVPVKNRKKIIAEFEDNPRCQVFLSTESGGSGLNLQVADTVINFELPWNPAKKNQRIGRIDRLGQKHKNLTVINLITRNSFEMKIAAGLAVKQNLFDNVLNIDGNFDEVDFSNKGRAQFLQELEMAMTEFIQVVPEQEVDESLKDENTLEEFNQQTSLFEEEEEYATEDTSIKEQEEQRKKIEEMEEVMNKGMDFLSGLFKMSTGKDLGLEENKIEIDRDTGEVVMRFKMEL